MRSEQVCIWSRQAESGRNKLGENKGGVQKRSLFFFAVIDKGKAVLKFFHTWQARKAGMDVQQHENNDERYKYGNVVRVREPDCIPE